MAYKDKFTSRIELEVDEATELAVKIVMQEGELRFRDSLTKLLEDEILAYLKDAGTEPNLDWVDGVCYVIKLLKEVDLSEQ